MINLLADDKKKEIRAGRANVILLRYIIMTLVAAVILVAIVAGAYFTLSLSRQNAQEQVQRNETERNSFSQSVAEAQAFRTDLQTAKTILDKEISYSTAILKIANSIPDGIVIDSLSLSPETIGNPISLTAHARDKDAALNLKTSFENNPELYSGVQIDSIDFGAESADSHPVNITLTVTINKEALR
jgi:Tfp pilus assembly protein PilN